MSDIITPLKVLKLQGMADCYAELKTREHPVQPPRWNRLNGCFVNCWKRKLMIGESAPSAKGG